MELIIICLLAVIIFLLILLLLKFRNYTSFEIENKITSLEGSVRNEFFQNRSELNNSMKDSREETSKSIKNFSDILSKAVSDSSGFQKSQLDTFSNQLINLTKTNEDKLEKITNVLESRLKSLQDDNNQKLEKMRETVDEKLQSTLEKRLGDSFRLVSERLELVHNGLGEMRTLAAGVGDIKKVLTNIKSRGVLGEYQLENILEQMLAPGQYAKNVKTKSGSNSYVEFAVKMPGRNGSDGVIWLPIDSKFPVEDYHTLLNSYEQGNTESISESKKILVRRIKDCAKDIKEKYIDPPNTTDFAIMFLPFEGLFAEVLNNAGLFESMLRDYKITITGPTTLSAFLGSLQMGFRTLAIEKRSSEVWEILGAVKTEFKVFGEILDKTKKKLIDATNTIESAGVRTRSIERKLKDVQSMSYIEEQKLFPEEEENEISDGQKKISEV